MSKLAPFSLEPDELIKIFPDTYYAKYANHLKLLQFEKVLISEEPKNSHLKFQQRKKDEERRIRSSIPKQQAGRVRVSLYDTFEDTIKKNKQQLKRMKNYNMILSKKIKISPERKNVIRTPLKNQKNLQDSIFFKMKAVQDMQFEEDEKKKKQARGIQDKQQFCNFVPKYQSYKRLSKSHIVRNPEFLSKSHKNIAMKLEEIANESLQKNTSIHFSSSKPLQKDASMINNINSALKRSNTVLKKAGITDRQQQNVLNIFKNRGNSKNIETNLKYEEKKRILIQRTNKIRQQSKSMATLKRFDVLNERKLALSKLQYL